MNITVLTENTAGDPSLTAEHGLSLLIRYKDHCILLDAGQSDCFARNARQMGIDLGQVQTAVLSHGHYDHGGGLEAFFAQNASAPVYAAAGYDRPFFFHTDSSTRSIGVPASVLSHKERFLPVREPVSVADGIWLLPHSTPGLSTIAQRAHLFRQSDGGLIPDDFSHELSLVFCLDQGLVICNSCSHSGLEVILREVRQQFPEQPLLAFCGGLHMRAKKHGAEVCLYSREEVRNLADCIRSCGLQRIYTGHCTGAIAMKWLKEELGDRVVPLTAGLRFTIG